MLQQRRDGEYGAPTPWTSSELSLRLQPGRPRGQQAGRHAEVRLNGGSDGQMREILGANREASPRQAGANPRYLERICQGRRLPLLQSRCVTQA